VRGHKEGEMTQRQGSLIIGLLVCLISSVWLFGYVLLRGQERTRKEAEAAQVSSQDVLEMQKEAAGRPSTVGDPWVRR